AGHGGLDLTVLQQIGHHSPEHRLALITATAQLTVLLRHGKHSFDLAWRDPFKIRSFGPERARKHPERGPPERRGGGTLHTCPRCSTGTRKPRLPTQLLLLSSLARDRPIMDSLLMTSSRDLRPRFRTFIISSSVLEIRSSTVLMLARLRQLKLRTERSSSSMVISSTLSRWASAFSTTVCLLPTFSA